ncbi:hypothetical protein ABE033_13765 [Priestia megaterium]
MNENEVKLSSDESLIEVYGGSPTAKSIVQLIPWIGPYLNEIVSEKANKASKKANKA